MLFKPVTTEKAVRLIDLDNTLVFEIVRQADKETIKTEFETAFAVKVAKVRTNLRNNVKYAYVKLSKTHKAADLATKLGVI
jgi:large subunit ribosomal protein L23